MNYGNYAPFYRSGMFSPMQGQPIADNQFAQPTMTTPTMQTAPTSDTLWVLNENEATSYPVAPNNSVVLWDKGKPTIYVKSVNAQGIPSMRILDFVERTEISATQPTNIDDSKFVTVEQFEALKEEFGALAAKYEQIAKPKKTKEAE